MVDCPVCGVNMEMSDDVVAGELRECTDCGIELEVKSINPITLAEAPQVEEDWGE